MHKLLTLSVLLFISGCHFGTSDHYTVYVNPDGFSDHQLPIVLDAVNEWQTKAANAGLSLDVRVENHSCFGGGTDCNWSFSIRGLPREEIDYETQTNWLGVTNAMNLPAQATYWADVQVSNDLTDDEEFRVMVLHELGHCFSLGHNFTGHQTSVMYPGYGPDVAHHITCTDIKAYADLRGTPMGFCSDE